MAADEANAREYAEEKLDKLANRLAADRLIIVLSDDFNSFRKNLVDPTYKATRDTVERPVHLYDMKDWFRAEYETLEAPYLEADDVMGIHHTDPSRTDETIIVSEDKDMMTIPGLLYRPQVQAGRRKPLIFDITPLEAIRFHFYQTIVGDRTDGYPGVYGVGPKSVYALDVLEAESEEEAWDTVLTAYGSKGLTEEDALRQARLARILHHSDYENGRVKLWLPPAWDEDVN